MKEAILLDEIAEQPAGLVKLLSEGGGEVAALVASLASRDLRHVVIAARGSSDNAARYAAYLFGAVNRLTVTLAVPSLFTKYKSPPRMTGALVIGISQSGESPDLVAVVEEGRRQGCPTLAVTNSRGSPLSLVAEHTLLLRAGVEQSVAATKTYTAQLFALAMVSAAMSADPQRWVELVRLPEQLSSALRIVESQLGAATELLRSAERGVVLGRGFNYATAFELSLKLKELARMYLEAYSSADFQHGPIALVDASCAAIIVNVAGAVSQDVEAVMRTIQELGGQMVVLSNLESSLALASAPLQLPTDVPEWLSPIVAVGPGQLLAFHLSRARGFDPGRPRGISKITRTS